MKFLRLKLYTEFFFSCKTCLTMLVEEFKFRSTLSKEKGGKSFWSLRMLRHDRIRATFQVFIIWNKAVKSFQSLLQMSEFIT